MTQLINKGGFRERANRNQKYKHSENEITTLKPNQYQPAKKDDENDSETNLLEQNKKQK